MTVAWISSRSASVMVLFLMVMGNIPIVYQNRIADASKKCMEMEKIGPWNIFYRKIVGFLG
jgi:hypothetical protein